jgi:hypothetical protein
MDILTMSTKELSRVEAYDLLADEIIEDKQGAWTYLAEAKFSLSAPGPEGCLLGKGATTPPPILLSRSLSLLPG